MKEKIAQKLSQIEKWSWQERPDDPRWKATTRRFFRLIDFFIYEAKRNALALRANALSYIIVLSLVPVMALGTSVLKGLGAQNQLKQTIYKTIENVEKSGSRELAQHLKDAADKLFEYVDRTNFATLGLFGIVGLIWAVISTLSKIEAAMNAIWKVKKPRPWGRKLLDYTAITVLLPFSLNIALGVTAASHIRRLTNLVDRYLPFPVLNLLTVKLLPIVLLISVFFILYRFLPNTNVKPQAALVGAVFGGIGWLVVQVMYIKLQIGVTRYNAIYGSFASVPLLLIWINLSWLIFLCGAQLAYIYQNRHLYSPLEDSTPVEMLAAAIRILKRVYTSFQQGRSISIEELNTEYPLGIIKDVTEKLVSHGVLAQTQDGKLVPQMPLEVLKPSAVLSSVLGKTKSAPEEHLLVERIIKAAEKELESIKSELKKTC